MENLQDFESWFNEFKEEPKGRQSNQSKNENRDYITKIYSTWPGNHGNIFCLPFTSIHGDPVTDIIGCMEFKVAVGGGDVRKQKLLPRNMYSFEPGSKEEQLYGELCSLFSTMYELKGNNYTLAKRSNVYLMYAWVLKHTDLHAKEINVGVPALLVMANRKFKEAWVGGVEGFSQLAGFGFVKSTYSRDGKDRDIILKISIKRPDQYLFTAEHMEITRSMHGLTGGKDTITVDQGIIDTMFGDPVNDFLGVDKVEERFNYDWYLKVKEAMQEKIAELRGAQAQKVVNESEPKDLPESHGPSMNESVL